MIYGFSKNPKLGKGLVSIVEVVASDEDGYC